MSAGANEENREEHRASDRLEVGPHGLARYFDGKGRDAKVIDLGYGGMRVQRKGMPLPAGGDIELDGTLEIVGTTVPLTGKVVHQSPAAVGVRFSHEEPTLLLFLRKYLEGARWGASLQAIGKEHVRDEFKGDDWLVLHGDGPVSMRLRFDSARREVVKELSLTIRPAGYYFVEYRDGKLVTGQIVEATSGLKSAMPTDRVEVPKEFLRRALFVLAGMPPALVKAAEPCLRVFKDEILKGRHSV
jgi:hypothetical protein